MGWDWDIGISGSFAGLGFLAWYIAGKIQAFDRKGHIAKLGIVLAPLLGASLVAVSRVDDYWHHWQDVFAGGLIGLVIASFCYMHFFPPRYDSHGWGPRAYFEMLDDQHRDHQPAIRHTTLNSFISRPEDPSKHHVEMNMVDSSPVMDELESGSKL